MRLPRTKHTAVALALALPTALFGGAVVSAPDEAQAGGCGSLTALVGAAKPGGTVDLPDGCTYREGIELDKPLTLIGGPGVEVRGSDIFGEWEKTSSGAWRSEESVPELPRTEKTGDPDNSTLCMEGVETCGLPEQVFVNGEPLEQVEDSATPEAGQFALDAERHVLLGEDSASRPVEVTTCEFWVRGKEGAEGVTIRDIAFAHAANSPQQGALDNGGEAAGWHLIGGEYAHAAGTVVALGGAEDLSIERGNIHHGGMAGIHSNDGALTVTDTPVHHNNSERYNDSWAAAGIKATDSVSLTVESSRIYANLADGIWTDTAAEDVLIEGNRISRNLKAAAHIEITDGARVLNNVMWENNAPRVDAEGSADAAIDVVASRTVEVADNLIASGDDGIVVLNPQRDNGRGATDPRFDEVTDVRVHDNTVLFPRTFSADESGQEHYALSWAEAYDGADLTNPASANTGEGNRFYYPSPEGESPRFKWGDLSDSSLEEFSATPGGASSRYLSREEASRLLRGAGLRDTTDAGAPRE